MPESISTNISDAIGNGDGCKRVTVVESRLTNRSDAIRMVMDVSEVQLWKVQLLISLTLLGMEMILEKYSLKVEFAIKVTLSGIVTDVSEVQFWKASYSIVVTPQE